MEKSYKIAITTGDKKGIGKEITKKALDILRPCKDDVVIIGEKIDVNYDFIEIDEKQNGAFCYKSLELACSMAKEGKIKALVTSPVSKYELHKSGYDFTGQTEVIESLLLPNQNRAQMLFIADGLRVMLLTRHIALSDIKLKKEDIIFQTHILADFLREKCKIENPKIALCALNPHAGENGVLGKEEIEILNPAADELQKQGIDITHPKSADALFMHVGKRYLANQKQKYDAILACYHDQGLCPLKALCFDRAVNTTIGLPIIRTSPPSGTAYDIAGKGVADPSGMVEAIKLALNFS